MQYLNDPLKMVHRSTVVGSKKFLNERGIRVHANDDLRKKHSNYKPRQEAIAVLEEIVEVSNPEKEKAEHKHEWLDNDGENDWTALYTYVVDKDGQIYQAKTSVTTAIDEKMYLYDMRLTKIEEKRVRKFTTESLLEKRLSQNERTVKNSSRDR